MRGLDTQLPGFTASSVVSAVIGVVVIGFLLSFFARDALKTPPSLSEFATGSVIDVFSRQERSGRSGTRTVYYVEFEYIHQNREYHNTQQLGNSAAASLNAGQPIELSLDPSAPQLSALRGSNPYLDQINKARGIGGVIIAVVILSSLPEIVNLKQKQKLNREGILLPGVLLEAKGRRQKGGYRVYVTYEFTTPEGLTLRRKQNEVRRDLRKKPLPQHGAPLAVLYAPPNTGWLM